MLKTCEIWIKNVNTKLKFMRQKGLFKPFISQLFSQVYKDFFLDSNGNKKIDQQRSSF